MQVTQTTYHAEALEDGTYLVQSKMLIETNAATLPQALDSIIAMVEAIANKWEDSTNGSPKGSK